MKRPAPSDSVRGVFSYAGWADQRQMQVEAVVVRGLDEVRELVRHDVLEADGRVGGQADVDAYVAG